ncbi:EYxxD motif small membrane protein [Halobacillus litoralis]
MIEMYFMEYLTDVGFVVVTIIGVIAALLAVRAHRRRNR